MIQICVTICVIALAIALIVATVKFCWLDTFSKIVTVLISIALVSIMTALIYALWI